MKNSGNFYDHVKTVFNDWNYGHPYVLYGLMRSLQPSVAVEIGTYRGFGAAWMAKALQENNHGILYCVDNFSLTDHEARYGDARRHLWENLEKLGVSGFVRLIDGNSDSVMLPDAIDFAYIDGWHSYKAAAGDFHRVAERGATCICFDDTTQSVGPRLLIEEIAAGEHPFFGEWQVMDILRDCGMTVLMKKQPKGCITFSQELPPPHKGTILFDLTAEQQAEHFAEAAQINGVDYMPILPYITEPK